MDIIGSYIGSNKEAQDFAFMNPSVQVIGDAMLTENGLHYFISEDYPNSYLQLPQISIEWDYEGILTVGSLDLAAFGLTGLMYGWADGNGFQAFGNFTIENWGSHLFWGGTDVPEQFQNVLDAIHIGNNVTDRLLDIIEINGVLFQNGILEGGIKFKNVLTNPFPAVGKTCTIKIKAVN